MPAVAIRQHLILNISLSLRTVRARAYRVRAPTGRPTSKWKWHEEVVVKHGLSGAVSVCVFSEVECFGGMF